MHAKETQAQLQSRLDLAATKVEVGVRYKHYKKQTYKVLLLALREEDNEPCVVYQAEYGAYATFIRPVKNWLETVGVDGKQVPRFTKLQV